MSRLVRFILSAVQRQRRSQYLLFLCLALFTLGGCFREQHLVPETVNYSLLRYAIKNQDSVSGFPDFSFAGYEKNEKDIPLVPVKEVITPQLGDDGTRIQDAINRVSRLPLVNGFRGAVLLKAGTYEVEDPLVIKADGVVLRGEGQGDNGTVVMATSRLSWEQKISLVTIGGSTSRFSETGGASTSIAADIPIGASVIPVADGAGFRVGDSIEIRKMVNEDWIDFLGMAQYGWKPPLYQIAQNRIVTAIKADTLFINMPMVDAVYLRYGGGYVATTTLPGRVSHCGVENMRMESVFDNDEDEMHAYAAVTISGAVNSWVRNITALYFVFGCVNITGHADFNTVQDCAMLDPKAQPLGSRMYSFYIDANGGTGNLFQRCYSRNARHDFGVSAFVTGPNAFVDCVGLNSGDPTGPHQRWSTGSLFDNIQGRMMSACNAMANGTGHGWQGAQTMFWNCDAYFMHISSPPGAINWAIGCRSNGVDGDGYWLSPGMHVEPRSLFFSQLKDRLGPAAVGRVAIGAQLNKDGRMWKRLSEWAGNGNPLNGLEK